MEAHVSDIVRVIQLVVAPVFMLTAVGTLINALNARLGRAVDRRRALESRLREFSGDEAASAAAELGQIAKRIRYVYVAILFAVVSALFVCLLIAAAFLGAMATVEMPHTVAVLFVLAILALIVSLLLFLHEIFLAVSTPRHIAR